jgi:hypothetical protein
MIKYAFIVASIILSMISHTQTIRLGNTRLEKPDLNSDEN